jgi:hypothetical protein
MQAQLLGISLANNDTLSAKLINAFWLAGISLDVYAAVLASLTVRSLRTSSRDVQLKGHPGEMVSSSPSPRRRISQYRVDGQRHRSTFNRTRPIQTSFERHDRILCGNGVVFGSGHFGGGGGNVFRWSLCLDMDPATTPRFDHCINTYRYTGTAGRVFIHSTCGWEKEHYKDIVAKERANGLCWLEPQRR